MTYGIETRADAVDVLTCFAAHAYMNGKFQAWSEGPDAWKAQIEEMTSKEVISIARLFAKFQLQEGITS
mgnify:CR=1 FL=1